MEAGAARGFSVRKLVASFAFRLWIRSSEVARFLISSVNACLMKIRTLFLLGGVFFSTLPFTVLAEQDSAIIGVGMRKQLFVDDRVVEGRSGLRRVFHQATKANDGKPDFTQGTVLWHGVTG